MRDLEIRLEKLERALFNKNETINFGKPKKSEEQKLLNSLFSKYDTLEKNLTHYVDKYSDEDDTAFDIVLHSNNKYNNVSFIVSGLDRDNMFCIALDSDNDEIKRLDKFNLDSDINVLAKFMLEIMKSERAKVENKKRKFEEVSLSRMDCESLRKDIEDALSEEDVEVEVHLDDRNADSGIVVFSIYDVSWVADYSIIIEDASTCIVECNSKRIKTLDTLSDATDYIVDHYIKRYTD